MFPRHASCLRPTLDSTPVTPFTLNELEDAAELLKPNKAPGPDAIPPEIVKIAVQTAPEHILKVINNTYAKGKFPELWKQTQLVLIEKPKKTADEQVKYRTICLINTLGKLVEHLISARLHKQLQCKISPNQFGFVKGRSTIDAMEKINEIVEANKRLASKNRSFIILITIDIENAFNAVPW